jgi:hypothetical protein
LSAEQQAKLREIKNKMASGELRPPQEMQRVLETKMQKVQEGVQRWQNEGRDPSPIAEIMKEFEPLMKKSKHKEAEAVLDRALKLLRGPEKDNDEKPQKKGSTAPIPKSRELASNVPIIEALQNEIEALRPARVAWREIDWKTCLLEGLKESRTKGKPLLLWIFIDRPADDARC